MANGVCAQATQNGASAYGSNAKATAENTTAIGFRASATQAGAVAIGYNAQATGDPTVAIGYNATTSGDNSVSLGANATATANNAVALGAGSIADEDNTVSVGSPGSERRITNVAAGVNPTDAVNVSQLNSVQQSVNNVAKQAYSGIAMVGALAGLPQVEPGKTVLLGAGAAHYNGYSALAIGGSARLTENTIVKMGVSAATGGGVMVNGGVGYSW
jgi:autotransporter adhesin